MLTIFIIDFISVVFLAGAFYLVWKERIHFYSLRPLLPAIVFLAIGHICDMLVEHPSLRLSDYFGLPSGSFELVVATFATSPTPSVITFLIYGFHQDRKTRAGRGEAHSRTGADASTLLELQEVPDRRRPMAANREIPHRIRCPKTYSRNLS